MHKIKIKFGMYGDVQTFEFKTEEEVKAFYVGLDAGIGYMEYEKEEVKWSFGYVNFIRGMGSWNIICMVFILLKI